MADAGYLTIGKVVKRLQQRFPDLTVSKVRFLEEEGLVEPSRTPGGYRLYSNRDVERLETILYLQKERFLPLSVIREQLDSTPTQALEKEPGQEGEEAAELTPSHAANERMQCAPDVLEELSRPDSEEVREKLHPLKRIPELCEGVSVGFVQQLEAVGVIQFKRSPHGRFLVEGKDLPLIRAAHRLRRFGIEPRNLRQYVQAAKRESVMYEQALMIDARKPVADEEKRAADLNEAFETISRYTNAIRMSLIRRQVAENIRGIHS